MMQLLLPSLYSVFFFVSGISVCSSFNRTSIRSLNYPAPYPSDSREEWTVITPPGNQTLIIVKNLDLEEPWDTLTMTHTSPALTGPFISCLRTGVKGFLFTGEGVTNVSFCSDTTGELGGFDLEVITTDLADDVMVLLEQMAGNQTHWCSSERRQLIASNAQCNGVFECANFTDDAECFDQVFGRACGPDYHECRASTQLCVSEQRVCDGWNDCPLGDDEENCGTLMCPMDCTCGESAFYGRYAPDLPQCSDPNWLPFWVNCTSGWNEEYRNNTAPKTIILNLNSAPVKELQPGAFDELGNVHTLDITSAQLQRLRPGVFDGMHRLVKIIATNNSLTYLENGTFQGLYKLRLLYLDLNQITRLDEGCFVDLHSLFFVGLNHNSLGNIRPGAFRDLGGSLERLILPNNSMTSLNSSLFDGIRENLLRVNIQENPVTVIAPGSFANLTRLTSLSLTLRPPTPLHLYPEFYEGLESLETVFVYDPRMCCILRSDVKCVLRKPPEPLFTCRMTILHNGAIKFFIWFLAFASLLGNTFVLVTRLRTKHTSTITRIQSILISNLAIADLFMGVYLLIIAIADAYIGDSYFWEGRAHEWRTSWTCRFAGFLSFLSSESSVFLIVLISVDRFICIVFPFFKKTLTVVSTRVCTGIIWMVALILSVVSVLLTVLNPDAYDLSDVCVGLPLIRKNVNLQAEVDTDILNTIGIKVDRVVAGSSASTWQYSVAIFLGVNFICFTIILVAYIAIFAKVRFSSAAVGRKRSSSNEIKMALKLSLIVATDFFCWMPIIILGVLVQADDVYISPDVYAWLVALVLPINSAINPYLYTIVDKYVGQDKSSSGRSSSDK